MAGRGGTTLTTPIVVAAQSVPAGSTLTSSDLTVLAMPSELVPTGAYDSPEALIGKIVITDLDTKELVTTNRLVGTRPQARSNEVLVPVRLADAGAAGLLAPGDVVSVIAANADGQARVIASGARVVTRPLPPAGFSSQTGSLVLLSVAPDEAVGLAAVSNQRALTAVLQ